MFCPHDVSLSKIHYLHLYIPTGYEPGLNALPNPQAADIRTRRTRRILASLLHLSLALDPCTF
jgi:hypothetical protein